MTGRLDLTPVPGLLAGASFFGGRSGQGATVDGTRIGGRVDLWEAHAQYEVAGLQLRALGAWGRVGDVTLINKSNKLVGNKTVGERQQGWYVQAAYNVTSLKVLGSWTVNPFVRYERLDTQARVPAGFAKDPATDRTVLTVGVGVKPLINIVLKADFQVHRNEARIGTNQFNVGLGFNF